MRTDPSRAPMAGGFLLALSILVGVFVGGWLGQPSIGLLAGFGVGAALAIAVWLLDRRR